MSGTRFTIEETDQESQGLSARRLVKKIKESDISDIFNFSIKSMQHDIKFIDEDEKQKMAHSIGLDILDWFEPSIRISNIFDMLPYVLHDGRELFLMKRKLKPLALFSYFESDVNSASEELALFKEEPSFVIREFRSSGSATGVVYYLIADSSESWRIDAFRIIKEATACTGWNETAERVLGSLLGYSRRENDIWIRFQRKFVKPGWLMQNEMSVQSQD